MDCGTRLGGKVGYSCAVDSTTIAPRSPRKNMHDASTVENAKSLLRTTGFESLRNSEWAKSPRTTYNTLYNRNWNEPDPYAKMTYRSTYREGFNFQVEDYAKVFEDANAV